MEISKDLKKMMVCGIALISLAGIGAVSSSASNAHASGINREGILNVINSGPQLNTKELEKEQKESDNKGSVNKKQYEHNIKLTQERVQKSNLENEHKMITPVAHKAHKHVANKHIRKHVAHKHYRKHVTKRVRKVATKRTKLAKRSIRKISNRIKHDKKVITRRHGRKFTKCYARKDLKKQFRALKKAKKMLAKSYKIVRHAKRARK